SMGGMIAMELANRLGPRASALGLVSTTAGGLGEGKDELAGMTAAIDADFRAFVREFAPRLFKAGAASPLCAWALSQMQKTPAQVASASLETLANADLRPVMKKITTRTMVFHGRDDALTPLASAQEIQKAIKGAALAVFDESGHAPHLEEPD